MAWGEFLAALALVCVLEGLLPFLYPAATRRVFTRLLELSDRDLRVGGLCSMIAGVLMLFLARS
jgi:hypothetical protein